MIRVLFEDYHLNCRCLEAFFPQMEEKFNAKVTSERSSRRTCFFWYCIDLNVSLFGVWRNTKLLSHSLIWSWCKIKVSLLQLLGYVVQVSQYALICALKAGFLLKKRRQCMCYSDYFSWIGSLFWSFVHEVLHDGLRQLFAAERGCPAPGCMLL